MSWSTRRPTAAWSCRATAADFRIRFPPTDEPKIGPNQIHLHLTSTSLEDQQSTVARALQLGARHLDVGQLPDEGHVVLADPEGNEFCVIEPGNSFLAGCGFLGELACDGSQEVGHFWSRALGWPLVWDQDQETAIQSPNGGTKIAWGGPPVRPKTRKNRMHFDVAPAGDGDARVEVDRLVCSRGDARRHRPDRGRLGDDARPGWERVPGDASDPVELPRIGTVRRSRPRQRRGQIGRLRSHSTMPTSVPIHSSGASTNRTSIPRS